MRELGWNWIFNPKIYLPVSCVFNGDFGGDSDLTGDMKFKNLLFAGEEYTKLFGVGVDPGEDISLVAQSEFFSTLHPKKRLSEIFA